MALAVLFVLVPVLRFRNTNATGEVAGQHHRDSANLMIFQERLDELDAELAAGTMEPEQHQALKAELERTLLTDMDASASATETARDRDSSARVKGRLTAARVVPLLAVLIMLPLSYVMYELWGFEDDLAIADIFERSRDNSGDPEELRDLIFELGAVIESDRENGWAWYFLARHLVSLGQMQEASRAFERASTFIENPQDKAVVLGQYAQAAYIAAGQEMNSEVESIIAQAQRLNPSEPSILQLLGAHAFVNEDYQSALTYWQQLLSMGPGEEDAQFLTMMIRQAQQMLADSGVEPEDVIIDGPRLELSLSLGPELDLPPQTRVFVSARNLGEGGPPLAAKVLTVAELPSIVVLSDADAVGPFNLSSAEEVTVTATVSLSGSADVQSGDFQARSPTLSLNEDEPVRLQMLITDPVP